MSTAATEQTEQHYTDEIYDRIARTIGRDGIEASDLHTLVHQLFDLIETGAPLPSVWRNANAQA